jgi:hypothetical protein
MRKAIIYYDGSNFYHLARDNFGVTAIDYSTFSKEFVEPGDVVVKIKFFTAPVNRQEDPVGATAQQKFFSHMKKQPEI